MVIHCIFKLRNHLIVSNILAVFSAMNIKSSIILRKHMKSVSIIGKFMGIANKLIMLKFMSIIALPPMVGI